MCTNLAMVEVLLGEQGVRLELLGLDRLWALKGNVTFLYREVSGAYADPKPGFGRDGWRIILAPATSVPGVRRVRFTGRASGSSGAFTLPATVWCSSLKTRTTAVSSSTCATRRLRCSGFGLRVENTLVGACK